MVRYIAPVMLLTVSACQPTEDFATSRAPGDQSPVPVLMTYQLTGDIIAGDTITVGVQLPVARGGIATRLVVGTSGEAPSGGPCPAVLQGECVDILSPDLVLGPALTNAQGRAQFTLQVPASATDTLWAQAVVVRPSAAYLGPAVEWTTTAPSCDDPAVVCGCMDDQANNFSALASLDDGSCTYYGNAASPEFYQGTWGGQIMSGDPDWGNRYGAVLPGWNGFDAEAIVDVLTATNQNLYVTSVNQPVYDPNHVDWLNAAAMVAAIDQRGADIDYMVCGRDDETATEYIESVRGTRMLRATSDRVLGYTIDDTNEVFALPTNDLDAVHVTQSEALAIQAVAHSTTEPGAPVSFIPYVPGEGVGMLVADDGIVLGAKACNSGTNVCPDAQGGDLSGDDFYIFTGDILEVTGTFNPGPITTGESYSLSFLMNDFLGYLTQYSMDVVVEINGDEAGRTAMVDAGPVTPPGYTGPNLVEGIRIFEMTVDNLTPDADNNFRVYIDTSGPNITRYSDRIAYLWDGQLTAPDGTASRLGLTDLQGRVERAPTRTQYPTDGLLAETNDRWRVREAMDGLMFKFPSRNYFYDIEAHERFVQSTCRSFLEQDQPCIEVYWGNDQRTGDVVGDPAGESLIPYFQASQDHSTGILVWMPSLNIHDRSTGILVPRDPVTTGYQVAAGFPGQTPYIPGWYHQWEAVAPTAGQYTIRMKEHGNISAGILQHEVWIDDTLALTEPNLNPVGGVPEAELIVTASAGQTITVRNLLTGGFGYGLYLAEYALIDPSGLPVTLDSHAAGFSEATEFMYQCYTSYYTTTQYASACGL